MDLTLNKEKNRIELSFPFNYATIGVVKGIGGRWDNARKVWHVGRDLPSYHALRSAFPAAQVDPAINEWAAGLNGTAANNVAMKTEDVVEAALDEFPFKTTPYDHQKRALALLFNNRYYALCMEMGTGKTKPVIDYIAWRKRQYGKVKVLVVAPLSVVSNWPNEAALHANDLTCSLLVGDRYQRTEALKKEADIYAINYAGMRIMGDLLAQKEWDVMVCDESQNIKNRTAEQSKACCLVGKRANRRYILTGTLVTNKPLDVFGQYKFLSDEILGANYYAFQSRYAIMQVRGQARFPVRFVNLQELAERLSPWQYRVLKSECLDLPEKIYEVRYAEPNPAMMKIYKSLASELAAQLENGSFITAPIILTKLLRFTQLTAGFTSTVDGVIQEIGNREKISVLLEVVEEAQGKVVVWTKFRKEMAMVRESLEKHGVGHVTLSGDDTAEERQESIDRFNRDDAVKVFVGQVEAGGTGINLTAASTCVYMSNSYSLGTRLQSEDRLHRIGQKNPVTYVDVCVPGTIDEKILKMLRAKKDIADLINQDGRGALGLIGDNGD